MSTQYFPIEIDLTEGQHKKIQSAIKNSHECTLRINPSVKGKSKLFVTQTQLNRLEKARKDKKAIDLTFSKEQLKHQTGGFLPLLGVLAGAALPFLVKGALAGAASAGAAKLSDFGVAADLRVSEGLTRTGALMGTPLYMPPEQLTGELVGPPADVYALSQVFHEVLTGRKAFTGKNLGALLQQKFAGRSSQPRRVFSACRSPRSSPRRPNSRINSASSAPSITPRRLCTIPAIR